MHATPAPSDDALARRYAWPDAGHAAWVRATMIASLDGVTTLAGRSGGLGDDADRRLFAVLRDLSDVVLVGAGTVRAEGYRGIRFDAARQGWRARWGRSPPPPPIAVVTARGIDPGADPSVDPAVALFTDTQTPPILITTSTTAAAAPPPPGVTVIAAGRDRVDLVTALGALRAMGLRRVHCEGGGRLLRALLQAGLVDELCLTLAPVLLGTGGAGLVPGPLERALPFTLAECWASGDHLFTRYRRRAGS